MDIAYKLKILNRWSSIFGLLEAIRFEAAWSCIERWWYDFGIIRFVARMPSAAGCCTLRLNSGIEFPTLNEESPGV